MSSERHVEDRKTRRFSRRRFLKAGAKASGLLMAAPVVNRVRVEVSASEPRTLLKNSLIVDGTGNKPFPGNVLIKGTRIEDVSQAPINIQYRTIDCTGKVVAPGFIDAHSHMDWVLPLEGHAELKSPFTAQGCTTFVAGNCGYSMGGFRRASEHKKHFNPGLFPDFEIAWDTMQGYFEHLRDVGMSHNLVMMAGHGTTRASIRWFDPAPMSQDELKELLALLEEAMDQGASGVSLGLQYAPGIFASTDELKRVAQLVKSKDKILTVHGRAYSSLSGEYKLDPFGPPHNVLALNEMIDIARETGVRLQYSHLMFAGTKSHGTYQQCLDAIDAAIAEGIDVRFDSYPYHCGNSVLNVILPTWFRRNLPENYHDEKALKRLEAELTALSTLVGLGYDDIQITHAGHPDFNQYNGMFLSEIAEKRGVSPFEAFIELSEKSQGRGARVLLHQYSNMEIIDALMQHPACLFMTDAVPVKANRNPAAYGSFALFLQYARERKRISLEEAIRKMTGASADRFRIKDRGYIKKGMAADLTVFDWDAVKDNTTITDPDNPPTGIEAVFMNGTQVLRDGNVDGAANAGQPLLS